MKNLKTVPKLYTVSHPCGLASEECTAIHPGKQVLEKGKYEGFGALLDTHSELMLSPHEPKSIVIYQYEWGLLDSGN